MRSSALSGKGIRYLLRAVLILLIFILGVLAGSLGAPLFSPPNLPGTTEPARAASLEYLRRDTATPSPAPGCRRPQRALLIILDGMRPDAIHNTPDAPFLRNLALNQGAYTWNGLTVDPSLSIPAHSSLFTGLDVPSHGVDWNLMARARESVLQSKSIFQYAKEHQWSTALISGKTRLIYFLQPGAIDLHKIFERQDNLTVSEYAAGVIANQGFGFMAINLGYTDVMGHQYGWMSTEYLNAVAQADQSVQYLLGELKATDYFETTLIVILADHGGRNKIHSNNRPEDETIPWIILGPCVKKGFEIPPEPRLRIFDTVPTILWALGWDIPPGLDGRVVREAFEEVAFPAPAKSSPSPFVPTAASGKPSP